MNLEPSCFVFALIPLCSMRWSTAPDTYPGWLCFRKSPLFPQHIYGVLILAQSETQLLNSVIQSLQTTGPAAHFLQPMQYWLQFGPIHHKYVTSQAKRNFNCEVPDSPEFDKASIYFSQTHNTSLSSICYSDWCLPSGGSPQLCGFSQT